VRDKGKEERKAGLLAGGCIRRGERTNCAVRGKRGKKKLEQAEKMSSQRERHGLGSGKYEHPERKWDPVKVTETRNERCGKKLAHRGTYF